MPLISHYQSTLLPMQLDQYLSDIAAGDHRAFILLYDAVSAPLYGLQLRILKDPQLAQEALTDTFLTIWNDAKSFNPRHGTPMVWLNIQARKQALATQDSAGLHDSTSISFPELTPDAWLHTAREYWDTESADEFEQLLIRLETLDVDAQACIVNLYCDGYTLEELSQVLGASPDTVKSWVREGLANLQLVAETGVDETEWNLEAAEYVLGTHTEENDRVYDALYKVDADCACTSQQLLSGTSNKAGTLQWLLAGESSILATLHTRCASLPCRLGVCRPCLYQPTLNSTVRY